MILCSLPSFLTAFLLFFLPESPKYHIYNNQPNKGHKILKNIYKLNHKLNNEIQIEKKRLAYEIIDEIIVPKIDQDEQDEENKYQTRSAISRNEGSFRYMISFLKNTTHETTKKSIELFKPPHTSKTILVLFIFFCLCFG